MNIEILPFIFLGFYLLFSLVIGVSSLFSDRASDGNWRICGERGIFTSYCTVLYSIGLTVINILESTVWKL